MLSQIAANGLLAASIYFLVAAAFGLYFSTARFFNFSYAGIFTVAAYLVYCFYQQIRLPFEVSLIFAIALSSLLAIFIDSLIYIPLKRIQAPPTVSMIASLGVYIILQNLVSLFFGDDTKVIAEGRHHAVIEVLEARLSRIQMVTILSGVIVFVVLALILAGTRFGKAIRAVASDAELAEVSGIQPTRLLVHTSSISSAFLALAGILVAVDVGMTPTMGMRPLMMGIVAVIIGGHGMCSYALGALLVGMSLHFGIWQFGSQWQDGIAFGILLAFLMFKPRELFNKVIKG